MFVVIGLMIGGVLIGSLLRNKFDFSRVGRLITWVIYALLFLLGVSVGINKQIMDHLTTLGVEALVMTLGAIAGSVLVAWALYKYLFQSSQNN